MDAMEGSAGRRLTRREFETVIRRAAELASTESEGNEGQLTEGELFRIAGEVGLDPRHVRRALTEMRAGVELRGGRFGLDRIFGPALIQASRVVPGTPGELAETLDEYFVAGQLLQRVRRGASILQYRPAVDWASKIARAASFSSGRYYIAAAHSVEVHLQPAEAGRTLVELVVDPGTRNDSMIGGVLGGGSAGVAVGVGAAVGLVGLGVFLAPAVVLAAAAGTGVTGVIAYATGQAHKKKLAEVQAEVEGVLDALEVGASLEPPPPSWRRWVKRNFHGVARDLMSKEESDGPTRQREEP